MTPEPTAEEVQSEVPFGLLWGIKRSFIDYVRRMPDGAGSVTDGAVPLEQNTILFPAGEAGPVALAEGADHTWSFHGDVRFKGHAGMLFVRVAAPRITVHGTAGELTIEDPYDRPDAERVPLVTLRLERGPAPAGAAVWLGSEVRLTEAGSALFNDVYPPGEPFEQLSVVLPASG